MKRYATALVYASLAVAANIAAAAHAVAAEPVPIDSDDIGGTVTGVKGPEAGVWVIAETKSQPTPYIKIVVTDDNGHYVIPDLPKGSYKVWVRGYGLQDSKPQQSAPGQHVDFSVMNAKSAKDAAQIYPPNYWLAMLKPPSPSEFPGTGRQGNGISLSFHDQQEWLVNLKENCEFCHQQGNAATRVLTVANQTEAWDQRVQMAREPGDFVLGPHGKEFAGMMNSNMSRFGRESAIKAFSDWSMAIAHGAVPPEAPPRPVGAERNVVVTLWDFAGGHFIHDIGATDKRNPTVNANGLVYGTDNILSIMATLDPVANKTKEVGVPGYYPEDKPVIKQTELSVHTPTFDNQGRVWISLVTGEGGPYKGCDEGPDASPYTKYFPNQAQNTRRVVLWDPKAQTFTAIPTCFGLHHLNFGYDKDNTLFFSGDSNVVGWIDTKVWDETHDPMKSQGWCPFVVDTNGDGKIDPDRNNWQTFPESAMGQGGGEGDLDEVKLTSGQQSGAASPNKDSRVVGFMYGIAVNPKDGSIWLAKQTPLVPSGVVRVERGAHPPQTCKTEYYQPPKLPNGAYAAFNARSVDIDSKGYAWVAFGSGQFGKFDRSKCKKLSGPGAIGQGCPEGWTFYNSPGPTLPAESHVSADWHYTSFVDTHDALGLGKDTAVTTGTDSDSMLALTSDAHWVTMRVPYPMGFYARGVDARIDDTKTGWKGKGLWSNYSQVPIWHQEDGEGSSIKLVKFQVRPDPLAH